MIKSKFARICDTILFVLGFGIVCFAWINKYIKKNFWSLFITALICVIIAKIIWSLTTKQLNKNNLKTQELKFAQNCIDYLAINPQMTTRFFGQIFENAKVENKYLIVDDSLHYFDYSCDQTTVSTLAFLNEKSRDYKVYLYSSSLSEKCKKLICQTQVVYVSDYDCYLLMKEKQIFPISIQKNENLQKNKFKQQLFQMFARKKAKPYFLYGILLLISSFFMPYSLLYCIVGSISVIFALVCIILRNNPQFNTLS